MVRLSVIRLTSRPTVWKPDLVRADSASPQPPAPFRQSPYQPDAQPVVCVGLSLIGGEVRDHRVGVDYPVDGCIVGFPSLVQLGNKLSVPMLGKPSKGVRPWTE